MTENMEKQKRAAISPNSDEGIVADLLKNLPAQEKVTVELPSRSKFYTSVTSSNPVTVRPMTFEDEKNMVSNKNPNTDIINTLLSRCISNININELLLMDKLFLIMKLREISYGTDYKVKITCPSCRKENKVSFNLSQLNINYLDEDFSYPISIHLPVLDKEIKMRLPRVEDEKYLQNADITATNIWRFIDEIDGHTKKTIISGVVSQLPIQDIHTILRTLNSEDYGVDPQVRFACNYCSHHESMMLPITSDFFTGN